MKYFFATLFTLFFSINFLYSTDPIKVVNNQLRSIFAPLQKPAPARLFLYDMCAHLVDDKFFTNYSTDTSNFNNWYLLNREMFYSAYDTTVLEKSDDIYSRAFNFGGDTIAIGLMDYDYYKLKDDALTTNIYFDFDTINDLLYDKSPWVDPYLVKNLFAASPLSGYSNFTNTIFRIDPSFLFIDVFNTPLYSSLDLKIDFGDGMGWIPFDPNIITHHRVTYPDMGDYLIKVALFQVDYQTKLSTSTLSVLSSSPSTPPSSKVSSISGVRIGIYDPCAGSGTSSLSKTILFLEGIDILDFFKKTNTNVEDIYEQYIKGTGLAELRNFGYTFVIVDWERSQIDLRENAQHVVEVIDWIKCNSPENAPIVVIGESMGGLVGRYALTYMETPQYYNDSLHCEAAKMHQTRLFITLDSPHQGANVPLSLQAFYKDLFIIPSSMNNFSSNFGIKVFNLFLDATAAKQMLIYHIDAKSGDTYSSILRIMKKVNFLMI